MHVFITNLAKQQLNYDINELFTKVAVSVPLHSNLKRTIVLEASTHAKNITTKSLMGTSIKILDS
jgi:hypothetical protein